MAGNLGLLTRLRLRHLRSDARFLLFAVGTDIDEDRGFLERTYQVYLAVILVASLALSWAQVIDIVEGLRATMGADASARLIRVLLQTVMENELPKRGKRIPMAVKVACAHAACDWQATYEDYAAYARDRGEKPFSRNTARDYRQLFLDTYLAYVVEGWRAPIRSTSRVRFKPRMQFVDPSIPAMWLTHTPDTLLKDAPALLSLLRCLVLRDLNVYASVLEMEAAPTVRYYADSDGAHADAVITLSDGRWGAINVAIGETQFDEAARGLTRLRSKLRKNPAAGCPDPTFLAVIMGSCTRPRLDKKTGVYAFPIGALTM